MNTPKLHSFLCNHEALRERLGKINPRSYDKTRNYLDGDVTWLSPFLTHGVLTTRQLADVVLAEHRPKSCYRFLFELGWREYFHRTWQLEGSAVFDDMRHAQVGVKSTRIPGAILAADTQLTVIDECINTLIHEGVMHNHARMWVAGICCAIAGTHWQEPARWLHYHLLDGDLASNTLSWQWIAGTFSHKQYVANQSNIDKYSKTRQPDSWLDIPYEQFDDFVPPAHLLERSDADYRYTLPGVAVTELQGTTMPHDTIALRSIWQLDPAWQADIKQHIVFIDTELASRWPMSPKRWRFIEHWAGVCNARLYHGTVQQLYSACGQASVVRSEYPACDHWPGEVIERDWLYPMPDKSFNSFSQYFKLVKHHAGL